MKSVSGFAALSALVVLADAVKLRAQGAKPHFPPEPEGEMPKPASDGSFGSKADACGACKFKATGSCAMYNTCMCYATNTFFSTPGITEPTDKDNWHWACGDAGGDKYSMCFKASVQEGEGQTYLDNFGDPVDPKEHKYSMCFKASVQEGEGQTY